AINPLTSSHMESTVTRLLVATKQLLESLTDWSHGRIDESCVSDIYVRLGNEFNAASLAFSKEGIDMNDLNSVPDDLRNCLEAALSEDASPMTLEQHLPQIRQIVVHLLQGLKVKQSKWRAAKRQQEIDQAHTSIGSLPNRPPGRDNLPPDRPTGAYPSSVRAIPVSRTLSAAKSREDLRRSAVSSSPNAQDFHRSSRPASNRASPPPPGPPLPTNTASAFHNASNPATYAIPIPPVPPPPRPDHLAQASSLEALRKTDTLQRRASKRFSTYTYNKIAATTSPHKRSGEVTSTPNTNTIHSSTAQDSHTSTTPTIFLQLGRDVKKAKLETSPTIASLRILFMERFQYSPGLDDFPTIYIRDPQCGVQYQLEDMNEVKDRVVLSLNIDGMSYSLKSVKSHIDTGLSGLARELKDLKSSITTLRRQSNVARHMLQRVNTGQSTSTEVASIAPRTITEIPMATVTSPVGSPAQPNSAVSFSELRLQQISSTFKNQFTEVQDLRRELGVLRQMYSTFSGETKDMIGTLRSQAEQVKQVASTKIAAPRTSINVGKVKLETRSQDLVTKIESLQDTVEDLKQDVTNRKIRPRPATMKSVAESINAVNLDLEELTSQITQLKPSWKKSWEEELQNIVDEQQLLNYQEDLVKDLKEDLTAVSGLFGHVKDYLDVRKVSKFKPREFIPIGNNSFGGGGGLNSIGGNPRDGLDTVLMQVKALEPKSEPRLKAIEAAERMREKNLKESGKDDEFAIELAGFVGGKKLKMTGGTEETERMR
ncbi:uncharacterized protein MELLADRAFT_23004, partial [Melampsora larici-populina 98AG31]